MYWAVPSHAMGMGSSPCCGALGQSIAVLLPQMHVARWHLPACITMNGQPRVTGSSAKCVHFSTISACKRLGHLILEGASVEPAQATSEATETRALRAWFGRGPPSA